MRDRDAALNGAIPEVAAILGDALVRLLLPGPASFRDNNLLDEHHLSYTRINSAPQVGLVSQVGSRRVVMINKTNIGQMLLVSALVMAASGEASAQTGAPKDYAEAMKYRKSADQGDAGAQYALGTMYENGHGVPKDYAESMKWYRKAADQGNADAQDKVGHMYFNGYGVPVDYAEAMKWFRKAVNQGNAGAQYGLGYM